MESTKDKRVKREIANSNERRRMQSINAGFQKLKRLLPVNDGEKISKANILQHAADFILTIERDRLALFEQNTLFRGILMDLKNGKTTNVNTALERVDLNVSPTVPINTLAATATPTATFNDSTNSNNNESLNNGNSRVHNLSSNDNTTDNTTSNDDTEKVIASVIIHPRGRPRLNRNNNKNVSKAKNNINSNQSQTGGDTAISVDKNNIYHDLTSQPTIGNVAEMISDKVASPKNGLMGASVAKAAIALPLEVPYTTETIIRQQHPHHHDLHAETASPKVARKLLKTDPTLTTALNSQDQTPKGQNLDTICKAIMEIEGDRVFKNEAT